MAKVVGVWGIDIGQCALKALRCTYQDGRVVADAFDFIEYPKILSQPEADPVQIVREALEQFLSRNDLKGNRVAISVPGQSGLAKFFKPPPVDAKKIPEIVKYEARQQIPFALEDVIWDYQQMGGMDEGGIALETEVGLFAMKREQVYRAIKPFQDAGVEVDLIQLAPLAIYNFVTHDLLQEQLAEEFNPDNPPPSIVVLSMGTDTTDLVITNGFRVWQRSIPLGGNHFTKQLTKELKLTFAKAEHLKRNARQAEDPKTVFQAMRPVFNDMVTEVQRSIGYFQGIDRKAQIGRVVVLGNTVKLPGLQQYLSKNLGYEVVPFDSFLQLEGKDVVAAPAFKDNQLTYGTCYGLCLQGLGLGKLSTNLVPREILTERMVRAKKPWAVASVGALLLACTFSFFFYYGAWYQVHEGREVDGVTWKEASTAIDTVESTSNNFIDQDGQLLNEMERITAIGEELVGNADRRLLWLEVLRAINAALPTTEQDLTGRELAPGEIPDVSDLPFENRKEIHIEHIETQHFDDLTAWFTSEMKQKYLEGRPKLPATPTDPNALPGAPAATVPGTDPGVATLDVPGPTGSGWVFEIKGYHYFNAIQRQQGPAHVYNTLIANLQDQTILLPTGPGLPPAEFTMEELGISYVVLVQNSPLREVDVPNPNYAGDTEADYGEGEEDGYGGFGPGGLGPGGSGPGGSGPGGSGNGDDDESDEEEEPPTFKVKRYDFVVQFVWQEKVLTERLEEQIRRAEQEQNTQDGDTQNPDLAAS